MVAFLKKSIVPLGFGASLYLVAAVFTYAKPSWFAFAFGPTLWAWPMFNSVAAYQKFFFIAATNIWIGSLAAHWWSNSRVVLCGLSIIPLLLINPWIAIWMGSIPPLVYGANQIIDHIRVRQALNTTAIIGLILVLLGPAYLILPWLGAISNHVWDSARVLVYSFCGIRIILYCYDWQIAQKKPLFLDTIIYFLNPAYFFINPSWIIAPRPSDIQYQAPEWKWLSMLKGVIWLFISIGLSALGSFSNILSGLATITFILFVSEFLTVCLSQLGIRYTYPNLKQPWLATSFVDFWRRFLGHTIQFINLIFVTPIRRRLRYLIHTKKTKYWIAIVLGLALLDIPIHYLGIYSIEYLMRYPWQPMVWFGILIGMLLYDRLFSRLFNNFRRNPILLWVNRLIIITVVSLCY